MVSAGVIPTPAIAYVTRALGFDAGLVISASHNPFEDNGIKVFSGLGEKFSEALEREVEAIVADRDWSVTGSADEPVPHADVSEAYIAHTLRAFPEPQRLGRFKLAIDTANGATTTVAPGLFRDLGYDVELIGANPDGRNINLGCGSTHPGQLSATVTDKRCRMGVAFDGDGDRAIFVDANGTIVDGDAVLLMCARQMKAQGRLSGNAVVVDRHEQHRPRAGAAGKRDRSGSDGGRRQVRDGGDAEAWTVARRRAVGPHHLLRPPVHGRRHCDGAQRAARDGRHRSRAR